MKASFRGRRQFFKNVHADWHFGWMDSFVQYEESYDKVDVILDIHNIWLHQCWCVHAANFILPNITGRISTDWSPGFFKRHLSFSLATTLVVLVVLTYSLVFPLYMNKRCSRCLVLYWRQVQVCVDWSPRSIFSCAAYLISWNYSE